MSIVLDVELEPEGDTNSASATSGVYGTERPQIEDLDPVVMTRPLQGVGRREARRLRSEALRSWLRQQELQNP